MLPEWISHTDDPYTVALVAAAIIIGALVLLRITFGNSRGLRRTPLPRKPYRRILMPSGPDQGYSASTLALACRLAGRSGKKGGGANDGASLVLVYVIEIPRALAPNSPMPEEEMEAQRVLEAAAETVRARSNIQPILQVRKGRVAVEETLRVLAEGKADLLVLTVPRRTPGEGESDTVEQRTKELSRRAPCEVILARAASA